MTTKAESITTKRDRIALEVADLTAKVGQLFTGQLGPILGEDGQPLTGDEDFKARMNLPSRLAALTNTLDIINKQIAAEAASTRQKVAHEAVNPMHDAIRAALDSGKVFEAMQSGEVGNVITFTATHGETGWAVNHKFAVAAVSTPKPAGEGTGTGNGTRAKVTYKADGTEFGAKDYLFKYFEAAKAAGYRSSRASAEEVPANEYSKISPVIAEKLGHEVVRVE